MRYIRTFKFSDKQVKNPNIYPYNSLRKFSGEVLLLDSITFLYGNNGSGKSTLLNLLATKLGLVGAEPPKVWGKADYFQQYLTESQVSFEFDEGTNQAYVLPPASRYLKSEDVLYEIKKIQQEAILREGYLYERKQLGMTKEQLRKHKDSFEMEKQIDMQLFAQEAARYLNCQFIIASHSPLLLGSLESTIYDLDRSTLTECVWTELENVRIYQEFFAKRN